MTPVVIEGTKQDIINYINGYQIEPPNGRWRVSIEPETAFAEDEEDLCPNLPDSPNAIRDKAHLEELLAAGLASPASRVTKEDWASIRQEVHRRYEERNKQK